MPSVGGGGRSIIKSLHLRRLNDDWTDADHLNFVVVALARAPSNAASAAQAANGDADSKNDDYFQIEK